MPDIALNSDSIDGEGIPVVYIYITVISFVQISLQDVGNLRLELFYTFIFICIKLIGTFCLIMDPVFRYADHVLVIRKETKL